MFSLGEDTASQDKNMGIGKRLPGSCGSQDHCYLTSVLHGFLQMWQGDASLQANQQSHWVPKANDLSIKDKAEMAPVLSAFKSLPSQLAWFLKTLALSLTSESAENSHFPFAERHNEWLE